MGSLLLGDHPTLCYVWETPSQNSTIIRVLIIHYLFLLKMLTINITYYSVSFDISSLTTVLPASLYKTCLVVFVVAYRIWDKDAPPLRPRTRMILPKGACELWIGYDEDDETSLQDLYKNGHYTMIQSSHWCRGRHRASGAARRLQINIGGNVAELSCFFLTRGVYFRHPRWHG